MINLSGAESNLVFTILCFSIRDTDFILVPDKFRIQIFSTDFGNVTFHFVAVNLSLFLC